MKKSVPAPSKELSKISRLKQTARLRLHSKLLRLWIGYLVNGDSIVLDFMTEEEVAEILAAEGILEVDMSDFNEQFLEDVATDSDYE